MVVAVGFTAGFIFMYIQCKKYVRLCTRWQSHNRIILIQNAPVNHDNQIQQHQEHYHHHHHHQQQQLQVLNSPTTVVDVEGSINNEVAKKCPFFADNSVQNQSATIAQTLIPLPLSLSPPLSLITNNGQSKSENSPNTDGSNSSKVLREIPTTTPPPLPLSGPGAGSQLQIEEKKYCFSVENTNFKQPLRKHRSIDRITCNTLHRKLFTSLPNLR